jgi:hypothetical protein
MESIVDGYRQDAGDDRACEEPMTAERDQERPEPPLVWIRDMDEALRGRIIKGFEEAARANRNELAVGSCVQAGSLNPAYNQSGAGQQHACAIGKPAAELDDYGFERYPDPDRIISLRVSACLDRATENDKRAARLEADAKTARVEAERDRQYARKLAVAVSKLAD